MYVVGRALRWTEKWWSRSDSSRFIERWTLLYERKENERHVFIIHTHICIFYVMFLYTIKGKIYHRLTVHIKHIGELCIFSFWFTQFFFSQNAYIRREYLSYFVLFFFFLYRKFARVSRLGMGWINRTSYIWQSQSSAYDDV